MKLKIISVNKKLPAWAENFANDYIKRFPSNHSVKIIEVSPAARNKGYSTEKIKTLEFSTISKHLDSGVSMIALDETGSQFTSMQLATKLKTLSYNESRLNLVIGGADGLAPECLSRAREIWSLSRFTFTHALARVMLIEQLYRAWSINNNHPYHREG